MLIVQSYFPNIHKKTVHNNLDYLSRQASLSSRFLKKHKYTVVLYTTEKFKNTLFKNSFYDSIVVLDVTDHEAIINLNFWSLTKLLAISDIKESCYHIDMDLFLIENTLNDHLEKDFLTLHKESWINKQIQNHVDIKLVNDLFNVDLSNYLMSYNAGIIGGKDTIKINSTINNLINIIYSNIKNIPNIFLFKDRRNYEWLPSVLFEQVLLPELLVKKSTSVDTIVDTKSFTYADTDMMVLLQKHGLIHLWNGKHIIHSALGIKIYDYIEKYYF